MAAHAIVAIARRLYVYAPLCHCTIVGDYIRNDRIGIHVNHNESLILGKTIVFGLYYTHNQIP